MSYICENCSNNNNGWCKVRKFNGLKKKDLQRCPSFDRINLDLDSEGDEYVYEVDYSVYEIPGKSGFFTTFSYKTKTMGLSNIKDEISKYLSGYFDESNFCITSINKMS